MSDLVERLRKAKFRQSHEVEEDAWEAADEIERLRKAVWLGWEEIERLRAALERIKYECAKCKYIAREALHETTKE